MDEEDEDKSYEIEYRNGWELRYHFGEVGNYMGVKKRKGVKKTSYQARISITKRKGDKRRQYGLGSFGSAEEAALAIAKERLKEEGLTSPRGDRKPRAKKSILDRLGIDQTKEQENSLGSQLLAQPPALQPRAAAAALPFEGNLRPAALLPVIVQPRLISGASFTAPLSG